MKPNQRQETRLKMETLESFFLTFSVEGWLIKITYPFVEMQREGRPETIIRGNYWWKNGNHIEEAVKKAKQYTTLAQIKEDYCL